MRSRHSVEGYGSEWIALWRDDLTWTADRFETELIVVAELDEEVAGFAAIRCEDGEAELEGLWVDPGWMGRGVGRALLAAARDAASAAGAVSLLIVSDPNAVGFYERAGARQTGWMAGQPAGRRLPRMVLQVAPQTEVGDSAECT